LVNFVLEIIDNLLVSKESECRTGGLNILGSLCGLGYNFLGDSDVLKIDNLISFWRCSENFVCNKIWKNVFEI
jgi:hypothetical protein